MHYENVKISLSKYGIHLWLFFSKLMCTTPFQLHCRNKTSLQQNKPFISGWDCCISTERWLFIRAHRAWAIWETEAVYISEIVTLVIPDLMKRCSRYALRHILHSLLKSEGLYSVRQTSECLKLMALSADCKQNCNPWNTRRRIFPSIWISIHITDAVVCSENAK